MSLGSQSQFVLGETASSTVPPVARSPAHLLITGRVPSPALINHPILMTALLGGNYHDRHFTRGKLTHKGSRGPRSQARKLQALDWNQGVLSSELPPQQELRLTVV